MKVFIEKSKDTKQNFILVHVNREEAGNLISSIAGQLGCNNPNHRMSQEFQTEKEEIFIIFVDPETPGVDRKYIEQAKWFEKLNKKQQEKWKKQWEAEEK